MSLEAFPAMKELKLVINEVDENNTLGPDGFNGCFYTMCWDINKKDFYETILEFFVGANYQSLGPAH